ILESPAWIYKRPWATKRAKAEVFAVRARNRGSRVRRACQSNQPIRDFRFARAGARSSTRHSSLTELRQQEGVQIFLATGGFGAEDWPCARDRTASAPAIPNRIPRKSVCISPPLLSADGYSPGLRHR